MSGISPVKFFCDVGLAFAGRAGEGLGSRWLISRLRTVLPESDSAIWFVQCKAVIRYRECELT